MDHRPTVVQYGLPWETLPSVSSVPVWGDSVPHPDSDPEPDGLGLKPLRVLVHGWLIEGHTAHEDLRQLSLLLTLDAEPHVHSHLIEAAQREWAVITSELRIAEHTGMCDLNAGESSKTVAGKLLSGSVSLVG